MREGSEFCVVIQMQQQSWTADAAGAGSTVGCNRKSSQGCVVVYRDSLGALGTGDSAESTDDTGMDSDDGGDGLHHFLQEHLALEWGQWVASSQKIQQSWKQFLQQLKHQWHQTLLLLTPE